MFVLDPRLAADTVAVAALGLSDVRLMNRKAWPWLVLVPRRSGVVELIDLAAADRSSLMEEIARCAAAIRDGFRPDKLNVGALGNIVPQLHVHIVGRWRHDPAWPAPVWGSPATAPYEDGEATATATRLAAALAT